MIVVGSHGRHGADRMLSGSISDRVCGHAACSVLVARARTIPHDTRKFPLQTAEPLA